MRARHRGVWWPGVGIGLAASLIGLVLALSGRPGVGYAVILVVFGLIVAAAVVVLPPIKQP